MPTAADSASKEVWIGLACVHQRPGAGVLMDENDAYVQVLALASTAAEFCSEVVAGFDAIGFDLAELEDAEPLVERRRKAVVDSSLLAKATEVRDTGNPRFGPFVAWRTDT